MTLEIENRISKLEGDLKNAKSVVSQLDGEIQHLCATRCQAESKVTQLKKEIQQLHDKKLADKYQSRITPAGGAVPASVQRVYFNQHGGGDIEVLYPDGGLLHETEKEEVSESQQARSTPAGAVPATAVVAVAVATSLQEGVCFDKHVASEHIMLSDPEGGLLGEPERAEVSERQQARLASCGAVIAAPGATSVSGNSRVFPVQEGTDFAQVANNATQDVGVNTDADLIQPHNQNKRLKELEAENVSLKQQLEDAKRTIKQKERELQMSASTSSILPEISKETEKRLGGQKSGAAAECLASLIAPSVEEGSRFDEDVQRSCSQRTDDNVLKRLADATCLIKAGQSNATGFHFMDGWIMTVGHIFQGDHDRDCVHTDLPNARFIFDIDDEKTEFGPQENRMAFIHHLTKGKNTDCVNMDIALAKLGRQYVFENRTFYERWEIEEQNQLNQVNLMSFCEVAKGKVSTGDKVRVIFHQYDDIAKDYKRKIEERTVKSVTPPDGTCIPTITVEPAIENAAVSGSPVLVIKDHMLVGLLFGGHTAFGDDVLARDGIEEYMKDGKKIISCMNAYMKLKNEVQKVKETLKKLAKDGKLTIYLVDGEKPITGQN